MTAPRPREQCRQPSPPEHPPSRRGGRSSRHTVTAAGRPAGFARLAGARRALFRAARAAAVVACLSLAGAFALPAVQAHTTNGPHGSEHTHFYLWRTTMTVGESSGTLGYSSDSADSFGSISAGADFGFPPWNPPTKHHFDGDSYVTVESITLGENPSTLETDLRVKVGLLPDTGKVTLWIGRKRFPFKSVIYSSNLGDYFWPSTFVTSDDPSDLNWSEDDEVRVALVYERRLPSAPTNVRVTAPPGEDGTLEVSWDEAGIRRAPFRSSATSSSSATRAVRPRRESSPIPAPSVPERDAATARRPACGARTSKRASNTRSSCRR